MKAVDTAKRNRHYRCLEYDHDQTGDICLIACGMERCDPGVNFGPEVRDCWHLHVILSGTGTLIAGGQVFHPRFGQMLLLKDNEEVQYTADTENPWQYCWVTYSGDDAGRISEEIGFTEGIYCLDTTEDPKAFYELVLRMHEKPEMNYINDLRRRGILLEYLALAMESSAARKQKRAVKRAYTAEVYVQKAVSLIDMNYAAITVSDVVDYIGFTRSYFTTIFHKYTGLSPREYILQCRFRNGCRLLTETDLTVQQIAEQVGYEDYMAFSKAFRKKYGMSPTAYRRGEAAGTGEDLHAGSK